MPEGPCWLLDYYAVCQGGRGQGAGSAFWRQLPGQLDGCQGLLIEVEDPDTAPTAPERETRRRRIRFYLKNGARETGCRCRLFGVEYRCLLYTSSRCAFREAESRSSSITRSSRSNTLMAYQRRKDVYKRQVQQGGEAGF